MYRISKIDSSVNSPFEIRHTTRGLITSISDASADKIGHSAASLIGKELDAIVAAGQESILETYLQKTKTEETFSGLLKLQCTDGTHLIWFYKAYKITLEDGETAFLATESTLEEYALEVQPNYFFDKVTDLNISRLHKALRELEKAKLAAEQNARIKNEFLANMSHEIRTPMNAVLGLTDILENTPLSAEQADFLQAIKISGQNLLVIINDILDFSKIESGNLSLENIPFDLRGQLKSLQKILQAKVLEKRLSFTISVDPEIPNFIIADPVRLLQVMVNLVGNAIKFTHKGAISLTVVIAKQPLLNAVNKDTVLMGTSNNYQPTLLFKVIDTGVGIPADKLEEIFNSFTQAQANTTRKYGGTGLGLSIAKQLVALHKGEIWAENNAKTGSTFSFYIPLIIEKDSANIEKSIPTQQKIERKTLPGISVLVAEDNLINQKVITKVLLDAQVKVTLANNGKEAVQLVRESVFDVILMDIQMPEMDGYEAASIIINEIKSKVPIIAFTAHAIDTERAKCLAIGMKDYVSKPFKANELIDKIDLIIKSKL